jgi:hypothetical protein
MGIHTSPIFHSLLFSLISKINLGFNWGDLGLVRMGIRTSPIFFYSDQKISSLKNQKPHFLIESVAFDFLLLNIIMLHKRLFY